VSGFLRGDANGDGELNIADGQFIFSFLFLGGEAPVCPDAADAGDEGSITVSSGIYILNFLFLGGDAPPDPGTMACGEDPTADELGDCNYPEELCP